MRAMARPKLGKIDIDYQKLHDAFFKWQTKPAMTMMGELYYEGKVVFVLDLNFNTCSGNGSTHERQKTWATV